MTTLETNLFLIGSIGGSMLFGLGMSKLAVIVKTIMGRFGR